MTPDYGTPTYESRWVREKLKLKPDASTADLQGELHVWDSRQHGYMAYIAAYKCDDKQGEIARLTARVAELEILENEIAEMRHAVSGYPNLLVMREQMEEIAAENRLLKQQVQALQNSGNFRRLVRNKRLAEQAAQTHGCHNCGEERPARIVAGKLTCPECGSENIVCID